MTGPLEDLATIQEYDNEKGHPDALAFCVRSGGAGKTHAVLNLGIVLARRGFKVRMWDLDPQRGLSYILGYGEPARGQKTIFHVLLGKASLAEATVPARYRIAAGDTDKAFREIPNLYLVHGTKELSDAEVTLGAAPAGNLWLANLRDELPEDEGFIDLVDCGPTAGVLQASIMLAFEHWVGCLNDEYKYIVGLMDVEKDIETARRKFRRFGCVTEVKHILVTSVYVSDDDIVNRQKSAIADDAVRHVRDDPDWASKLLPIVRYEQKAKEVFFKQKPLRFHAPMSPALDDFERVADVLGYPRRAPQAA
ncbi:ParA family protein [Kitasatospora sp. NPDC087315]|uniref:ParA family protein n=1 Tax=Kitasatospora sp. NPDC087315 TaxID=3364069 RepID=UPI003822C9F0